MDSVLGRRGESKVVPHRKDVPFDHQPHFLEIPKKRTS